MGASVANLQMIEQWNGATGAKWVRLQSMMDALFDAHGAAVLDAAGLAPGEAVLDVGCGCGATSLEAGRRVGSKGLVVGVDISAPMLARATARAETERLEHVRFERGDVQTESLGSERYDAVVSRLGVMFFDDPVAAFSNVRGAARDGARLAFVCWQSTANNPWITVPARAAAEVVPIESMETTAPGPFAFADSARVIRILETAGFAEVRASPLRIPICFGRDADEAGERLITTGPAGRALLQADETTRGRAARAVAAAISGFTSPSGVILESNAWLVTARRRTPR